MIHLDLQVRHATLEDYSQIADLLYRDTDSHRHLDWRSALDWVGGQNYWVLEQHGGIRAVFACPEDPPNIAWIRVFACDARLDVRKAWSTVWESVKREITEANPKTIISAIAMKPWFHSMLLESRFKEKQQIVLLQLEKNNFKPVKLVNGIHIRPMQMDDLNMVGEVDLAAFGPLWHNTAEALGYAMPYSAYSSVAEDVSGIIAYQISTANPAGAHLARLAVHPEAQGRGIASALITDLCNQLDLRRLSVNTQSDNTASLALYKKLGFFRTGETFPVLMYPWGGYD